MNAITPFQKVKLLVMLKQASWNRAELEIDHADGEAIDVLYEQMAAANSNLQDARNEVRGGTYQTGLISEFSRNYESDSVAAQLPDGSWVGWTYWQGGGKHGDPASIPWMEDAYKPCTHRLRAPGNSLPHSAMDWQYRRNRMPPASPS